MRGSVLHDGYGIAAALWHCADRRVMRATCHLVRRPPRLGILGPEQPWRRGMILTFPEVVSEAEHREILGLVAAAEFVDGRETASPALARTKDNEQIRRDAAQVQAVTEILLGALRRNTAF